MRSTRFLPTLTGKGRIGSMVHLVRPFPTSELHQTLHRHGLYVDRQLIEPEWGDSWWFIGISHTGHGSVFGPYANEASAYHDYNAYFPEAERVERGHTIASD